MVGLHLPVEQLERPFEGALGVCVAALTLIVDREVVERERGFWVVGTERLLLYGKGSLVEMCGVVELAASLERGGEVV